MLKDFLIQEEFALVPYSGNRVSVNHCGKLQSLYEIITEFRDENNDRCVNTTLYDGKRKYLVADVVAHAFKPIFIPSKYWNKLTILFLDGNKDNVHPGNLIWKYPMGLCSNKYPEYAFIPGYSRYVINREGRVINFLENREIKCTPSNGYFSITVIPDHLKRSISAGRHRLLALAWLDYPPEVDRLDVNHINGIRGSDALSNLEWATRQRNCQHAYENGLRNDNHEILVRNVITNEIKEYYSYEDCARDIGKDGETIRLRVKTPGQLVYPGDLQFKRKEDPTPWREITDLKLEYAGRNLPVPVKIRNIFTNEVTEYRSVTDAAIGEKVQSASLEQTLHLKVNNLPYLYLNIKHLDDNSPWPIYTERELECFKLDLEKGRIHKRLGYMLVDLETNQETLYSHMSDVLELTGVKIKTISQAKDGKYRIRGKWKIYYV